MRKVLTFISSAAASQDLHAKALAVKAQLKRAEHYPRRLARPGPKVEPVVEKGKRRGRLDLAR